MRKITFIENKHGMIAIDNDGQFVSAAHMPGNKIEFVSFLHGDDEAVIAVVPRAANWRYELAILMGLGQ